MVWEIIFIWSVPQFGGSSHSLKEAGTGPWQQKQAAPRHTMADIPGHETSLRVHVIPRGEF